MIFRKNIIKFWVYFVLVLAVALGAITLVYRWQRIFPSKEVSELYRRYANTEGVEVSYVKKYRINDTLTVDVTLIETADTSVWDHLCEDFNIPLLNTFPEDIRRAFLSDQIFEHRGKNDTLEINGNQVYRIDLLIFSRKKMMLCVYHSLTYEQYDAIINHEIDKITY